MPLSGPSRLDPTRRIEEFAQQPDAAQWASECAWVSGTGHCRDRDCPAACTFRRDRLAEAERVRRWRQLRRMFARLRVR